MKRQQADAMFRAFQTGELDRRTFVTKLLALGASASSVSALLQACSGGSSTNKVESDPNNKTVDVPPTQPAEEPPEKKLSIYNWSDYIAEDTVSKFTAETGIEVEYTTYESNEEMMAKLQIGAGGYDLVVPTGYIVTILAAQDLLHPLDKSKLKNWDNVAQMFRNPKYDPDNKFAVPYLWGTSGIAYRSDKVDPAPDSWAIFHDKKYKGKMTQADDMRDTIGAWLKFRGKSLNSTDPEDLKQAKKDALAAKPNLKAYLSAPVKGQLVAGDVWIAQLWDGDTAQAKAEQESIRYVIPKEGAGIWTDSLVIPKSAPHKRAAHAFLDFVLRPDIAASISNFTGYGTPNQGALDKLTNPVPYPSADEMTRLEYQSDLAAATELWDRVWNEIKAG